MPVSRLVRRIGAVAAALVVLALVAAGAGAVWMRGRIRAALPALDGAVVLRGLGAPVTIERDALGVPTIRGAGRLDVARATGFLHGQERFFQMDLSRRRAAGELAALFGPGLLEMDRRERAHRFRDVARRALERASADDRAGLTAYAEGVNAGLASLGAKPFEYIVLRHDPAPWLPEDSELVVLAMYLELQDEEGRTETALGLMRDALPPALHDFLAPRGTEWDAPIAGEAFVMPAVPGPEVIDLRAGAKAASSAPPPAGPDPLDITADRFEGSNNWAVSGAHTAHGGAIVANDMHLGIGVPNTWYRAAFLWSDDQGEHRVTGVTLPGTPVMVVGSNGHVAWGFTNSYGDWGDVVLIEPDPNDKDGYLTPEGPRRFDHHTESIAVAGAAEVTVDVVGTIWGPLLKPDARGRQRAFRWVAHDPEAVNEESGHMETARTIEEAFEVAHRSGIPAQNLVVADSSGRVGWTIMGKMPRRVGFDGSAPASWADGTRRWDGWLSSQEQPAIIDPPSGRVWSANARVVGGPMLTMVGDGGYDLGARAKQVRDGLLAIGKATERDMLAIQTDDRALFLQRWRDLLLHVLDSDAAAADPRRVQMKRFVEEWGARASIDSVGYRLVRAYRTFAARQILDPLVGACRQVDPNFSYGFFAQYEGPLWAMVSQRPAHLLDPKFKSWDEQMLAVVDETLDYFVKDGSDLGRHTWGERNTTRFQHPLSLAMPPVGRWLDMPSQPLPGDNYMPRVQGPDFGASERMAVSPGREEQGYFHMPCGQSGNPMSPHYADGHGSWANAEPTPFLPGPVAHTLRLTPPS